VSCAHIKYLSLHRHWILWIFEVSTTKHAVRRWCHCWTAGSSDVMV